MQRFCPARSRLRFLNGVTPSAMRHVPERTCSGCGLKKPQKEFVRVAAKDGGAPNVDRNGRLDGRGAYLCRDVKCAERAFSRRSLERSLKLKDNLTPAFKDEVWSAIEG